MSEYFRRVVIRLFLNKDLINAHLATSLSNWTHSGFSGVEGGTTAGFSGDACSVFPAALDEPFNKS